MQGIGTHSYLLSKWHYLEIGTQSYLVLKWHHLEVLGIGTYTLIFSIEVTSFGNVLFGRFYIYLKQWAGGNPCLWHHLVWYTFFYGIRFCVFKKIKYPCSSSCPFNLASWYKLLLVVVLLLYRSPCPFDVAAAAQYKLPQKLDIWLR